MPSEILTAAPGGGSNAAPYTVSELSGALKRTIETAYAHVRVRGEISACKRHSSGHVYFCLKDNDAVIDAVCWRGTVAKLALQPADGIEIIATGRVTTYPGRSRYQLVVEQMELAGEGALLKMLEDRKRRLAAEGLFDAAAKRKLPYLPEVIGVITSPTGAVIRDILHRLEERFPRPVLVWPVAVQGETAAREVAAAIAGFNALPVSGHQLRRPDLLIVARGGGSLEDLMAFNEEIVVRAAAASTIPLISAVGHETDTTLIDFVSDRRAPTPTAAAEMAVPVRLDLLGETGKQGSRLSQAMTRLLGERHLHLGGLARGLGDPRHVLDTAIQRLDDRAERLQLAISAGLTAKASRLGHAAAGLLHPNQQIAEHRRHADLIGQRLQPALARCLDRAAERVAELSRRHRHLPLTQAVERGEERLGPLAIRLTAAMDRLVAAEQDRLAKWDQLLGSLSPYAVLKRGYALVEDQNGQILTLSALTPGLPVALRFHDGEAPAQVTDGDAVSESSAPAAPPRKPKPRGSAEPVRQPSLF